MGKESPCCCIWNGSSSAEAKALLESTELILRGSIRQRIPLTEMRHVRATGCELSFSVNDHPVTLHFPTAIAEAWAKRILSPPVSLTTKLGIREDTGVLLCTSASSEELQAAVSTAKAASWNSCDLAVAEVTTEQELNGVLSTATSQLGRGIPLWIIYRKGSGQPVSESLVRKTARALGWNDNKVASISKDWTGLRFGRTVASR